MTGRAPLPHRGRAWLLGVVVPVVLTLVAVVLVWTWAPRLPDPVVTHWGSDGPDATGTLAALLVPFAIYGGLSLLVCAGFAVLTGRTATVRRMTAGIATGMAALNGGLALAAVHSQLDAAAPADVADPGSRIVLAAALAVVLGGLAAALAGTDPHQPAASPVAGDVERAAIAEGDTPVWEMAAAVSRSGRLVSRTGAGALLVLGLTLGSVSGDWWIAVLVVAPAPLLLLLLSWHVRVDPSGLTVRADLGRPRQHVPASEVERAEVTTVSPFGDFGGWGLRIAPDLHGTVGVVLRAGEAIRVHRTGGRRFVVTVDDAAAGAALLNTYAGRARPANVHDPGDR